MIYYEPELEKEQWILKEPQNSFEFNEKTETVFSSCNGYMGVRASWETRQLKENRGIFIAGLYHKAGPNEITELIHGPDITEFSFYIDGVPFFMDRSKISQSSRKLNVMTGELLTELDCRIPDGNQIGMKSGRFASLDNPRLFCHQVTLTPSQRCKLQVETGINSRMTNSGTSHFAEVISRVFDKKYLYSEHICDDGQILKIMTLCVTEQKIEKQSFSLLRRQLNYSMEFSLEQGQQVTIQKYSLIDTSGLREEDMKEQLENVSLQGYQEVFALHNKAFEDYWKDAAITIEGAEPKEKAAIALAQYHLLGMAPAKTHHCSIAAKGLTGEGYRGHVFWDTELFIMPYFTLLFPEIARNLLLYRYHRLEGAKKKAKEYGYQGAMFPWESAKTGEEETPLYAALNIHTGKAEKVWSGIKEHHVTADIIFGLWNYYQVTNDREFMDEYGNEMIFEAAKFWYTRAVWKEEKGRYELLDLIGPDEYTEHIDNNTYTNYMAYETVHLAKEQIEEASERLKQVYLDEGWDEKWQDFCSRIYLPSPNSDGIIPQDDTFLSKPDLPDIEKYKNSKIKQLILKDYTREQVVNMQVLKQADLVMLMTLMPRHFSDEIIKKNVEYYEKRTIHDSSLSYCAHGEASAVTGDSRSAWSFFEKALEIDLSENEKDSTDGIHSASLGGILNCLLRGFAGVSIDQKGISVTPHLPKHWKTMEFCIRYRNIRHRIHINGGKAVITQEEKNER